MSRLHSAVNTATEGPGYKGCISDKQFNLLDQDEIDDAVIEVEDCAPKKRKSKKRKRKPKPKKKKKKDSFVVSDDEIEPLSDFEDGS